MKKSSIQKSKCEVKCTKKQGKISIFEIDKQKLQCFKSKEGYKPKRKPQEPKNCAKQEQHITKGAFEKRSKAISFISTSYKSFNNQVLFLQYGKDDVYVDSTKAQGRKKSKTPSPPHESERQDQYDFQTPCVRVITEETDNTSNPISTRFPTPDITPQSSRIYSMTYNDQQYYNNIPARNKRSISYQQSRAFVIDLDNIQADGRSTVMVRNIPNKYTQEMLIKLFSENHRIKFDFFYLPIDYKYNCNVGYAFINFIHAKFIGDFYSQFHNTKWQKFNSQKICQVCYARIQGKAQLSSHFQYSKVIQQKDKKYRPLGLNESTYADLEELVQKQKNNQK